MAIGPDVLVVGAGVIGLSTAVQLAENGWAVEVRSECLPVDTTSAAAGAMWNLALVEQREQSLRWGRHTLTRLALLAADPRSGVRLVGGIEACRDRRRTAPDWMFPPGARACDPAELPPGFECGRRYTMPLIDMPVYLEYLRDRLHAADGRLRIQRLSSFDEVAGAARVIVNCAGAGAGALAEDPDLEPIRGQVVVATNPGLTEFFAEEDVDGDSEEMLYILPHGDRVVLGGTAQRGNVDRRPDRARAEAILARCIEIEPLLAAARVLDHRVGVRPGRACIRFEEELLPGGARLIHCYGHGGAGVSLSWGCAEAILAQVGTRVG